MRLALVMLGGAVGSAARYLVSGWALAALGSGFPWGTLTVNVVGSFLISILMFLGLRGAISPDVRLLLATGVMGGFTTYSSFNYDTLALFQQGAWLVGALNVAATVVGCMLAGAGGLWLARAFGG